MSGRVVHFDIPAADVQRAQSFYQDAFGWKITDVPGADFKRVGTTPLDDDGNLTESGSINGGMIPRAAPVSGPVVTVDVDDIDEALARIEQLGGKAVMGKRSAGYGFIAYFTDTEDNLMGLWQTARH
jgi:uncharacterized protein